MVESHRTHVRLVGSAWPVAQRYFDYSGRIVNQKSTKGTTFQGYGYHHHHCRLQVSTYLSNNDKCYSSLMPKVWLQLSKLSSISQFTRRYHFSKVFPSLTSQKAFLISLLLEASININC